MNKVIIASIVLLIITGLGLTSWFLGEQQILVWFHLLVGFLFIVAFILFSIDHISNNIGLLKTMDKKNVTGSLQVIICLLLIATGFILYLYGSEPISPWSSIHLWATFILIATTVFHLFYRRK